MLLTKIQLKIIHKKFLEHPTSVCHEDVCILNLSTMWW